MRNRFSQLLCSFVLLCSCTLCPYWNFEPTLHAQKAGNPALGSEKTLTQQFDDMLANSNRYQTYRVVPIDWLNAFKINVLDSLSGNVEKIKLLEKTLEENSTTISEQTAAMAQKDEQIAQLEKEKDGISLFGTIISKGLYNMLLWGLIVLALGAMFLAFARGKLAVSRSHEMEKTIAELSDELDKSKRRRLEVEQDLRRQLQDQINKNKQLGGH